MGSPCGSGESRRQRRRRGVFQNSAGLTITATGGILADGWNGGVHASTDGSGGGGAGGYLWFGVSGTWTNSGSVSAHGGTGGGSTDYGSGGYVNIDPLAIVNNGVIDVTGGGGITSGLVNLDSPSVGGSGSILGSVAPEPGTFALAGIALAIVVRRRRVAF